MDTIIGQSVLLSALCCHAFHDGLAATDLRRIDAGLDGTVALAVMLESETPPPRSTILSSQLLDVVKDAAEACTFLMALPDDTEEGCLRRRRGLYALDRIQRAVEGSTP